MPPVNKNKYFESLKYKPHSGQQKYHDSDARFRVAACGRRFGKTLMVARDRQPQLVANKDFLGWIVGPTYALAEKEFRVFWNDLMVTRGLLRNKNVKRAYNLRGGEMYIELPSNSRLEVKSATQPEYLVGEGLDFAIMSEAAKHSQETWERFIRPALTDKRGGADFPSTPEGYNWFHDLWLKGQNPGFKSYASWRFPSYLNDYLFPEGYEDEEIQELLKTVTPEWFAQEIEADFASFVGKIYSEFNIETHCINYEFNPDWPNYVAFDWGFSDPLAAVEFQVSPSEDVYVWREHYKSFLTLPENLRIMKEREQPEGYRIDLCFGDAADPAAVRTVNQIFGPCIADPESKSNWRQGIDLVKKFLREYDTGDRDDYERPVVRPKYYVDFSCENHIKEMQSYRTKVSVIVKESNEAGAARKENDHTCDAMRYAMMHLFELGAESSLADVVPTQAPTQIRKDTTLIQRELAMDTDLVGVSGGYFSMNRRF